MDYKPHKGLNKIVYYILIGAMVLSALFYVAQYLNLFDRFSNFSFSWPHSQSSPVGVPQGRFIKTMIPSIPIPPAYDPPEPMEAPILPEDPAERDLIIRPKFQVLIDEYQNEDIIGYLLIEGTTIDYPVFQSHDNNFYLANNEHKQPSSAGTLYLDYENDIALSDQNMVIYGHNMNADIMFHSLRYYRDEEFFREHQEIVFDTLYDDYIWEAFAFYDTHVDFAYTHVLFQNDGEFMALANEMAKRSIHENDIDLDPRDRILTLSTCTNISNETRYVLNCRLKSVNGRPVEELWAAEEAYQQALTEYEAALANYEEYRREYEAYEAVYQAGKEERELYEKIINYTID